MDITPHELLLLIKSGKKPIVVDVREKAEWDSEHIPQTIHIPLGQIPYRMHDLDPEQEIIIYCRSGHRSAQAMHFLESKGFKRVKNLKGGIRAWLRVEGMLIEKE